MNNETNCRSCGKPIRMLKYQKTGKLNPIEKEPHEKGNLVIPTGSIGLYRMATAEEKQDQAKRIAEGGRPFLHISHFATCGDAPAFRRAA